MMARARLWTSVLLSLILILGTASPLRAQLGSVPNTFTSGTTISSASVNQNFSTAYANALNRTGGTMTGVLTTLGLVPTTTNASDIGTSSVLYRSGYFGTSVILGAATTSGVRLDLETGVFAVREGDDSGYAPLTAGAIVGTTFNTYTLNQSVASGASPTFTGTNFTGIPVGGLTGLGTGVATLLATPSSANLLAALTDETGTGVAVFSISPSFTTPSLGAATATTIDTGFGANELYDMDQHVLTSSTVSFSGVSDSVGSMATIRAGGIGIASQAQYDLMTATSSTQWQRIANGTTGQVLTATTGGYPAFATATTPAVTLLHANSGTSASAGATNLDTFALSGLTDKDVIQIIATASAPSNNIDQLMVYNSTSSVVLGTTLANAPHHYLKTYTMGSKVGGSNQNITRFEGSNTLTVNTDTVVVQNTPITTGFTVALRWNAISGGDTGTWAWQIIKIAGQ